jgi:NADH-quinone oxidoreductase subunit E
VASQQIGQPVDIGMPDSTRVPEGVPPLTEQTRLEAREIVARYPKSRSALLPMLHLVQSVQGYVSPEGITLCAEELGLTKAEVGAVATFYTQYRRRPAGRYHVGVCTNTLCAVLGGDAIFESLKEHVGVGHNETTDDGMISLEHLECNAACDYAPVVMVNWEFHDDQTPATARDLVDRLRAGEPVAPTRGPDRQCTFKEMSRVLAGFPDGVATQGVQAGPATLAGVRLAEERGERVPEYDERNERP